MLGNALPEPAWSQYEPNPPGALSSLFGGKNRYQDAVTTAKARFEQARNAWRQEEGLRSGRLAAARERYERDLLARREENERRNALIELEIAALAARERRAVGRYLERVLGSLSVPADFPRRAEVAYNPDAEQAVVQVQLPAPTRCHQSICPIHPERSECWLHARNEPAERELKQLYRDVIAQVALLSIRDLFDADPHLGQVAFNGHVDAVNSATGQAEYPCPISLNVERGNFEQLILDRVTPADCLHHLNALVSEHPFALKPIQPVINFDLSKYNFIDGLDAVATLDHRPDLMDMGHGEFEHLVRQVFEAIGMQGWTTTSSNDDGVDGVVTNPDPFVGGLTIVQAKHYRKVVGVNHIRELAGAMEEKKAGRGILVTTSWFTAGGWQKAYEHGRMQLVDGQNLSYLIKKHIGKDVVIGVKRPRNAPTGPSLDKPGRP